MTPESMIYLKNAINMAPTRPTVALVAVTDDIAVEIVEGGVDVRLWIVLNSDQTTPIGGPTFSCRLLNTNIGRYDLESRVGDVDSFFDKVNGIAGLFEAKCRITANAYRKERALWLETWGRQSERKRN